MSEIKYKQVELLSIKDNSKSIWWVPAYLAIQNAYIVHKESKEEFKVNFVYNKSITEEYAKALQDKFRVWRDKLE